MTMRVATRHRQSALPWPIVVALLAAMFAAMASASEPNAERAAKPDPDEIWARAIAAYKSMRSYSQEMRYVLTDGARLAVMRWHESGSLRIEDRPEREGGIGFFASKFAIVSKDRSVLKRENKETVELGAKTITDVLGSFYNTGFVPGTIPSMFSLRPDGRRTSEIYRPHGDIATERIGVPPIECWRLRIGSSAKPSELDTWVWIDKATGLIRREASVGRPAEYADIEPSPNKELDMSIFDVEKAAASLKQGRMPE